VEFFKSEKLKNPEDLRILALFSDFKIPLLSTSKSLAKCLDFFYFSVHCCADLCGHLGGKSDGTLHGL
jgi:hypothetical protein